MEYIWLDVPWRSEGIEGSYPIHPEVVHLALTAHSADIRKLLISLPHARMWLDTKRYFEITASELLDSARLPRVDFDRVHNDVRIALDVVVEYCRVFCLEDMAQASTWDEFSDLLYICYELARADITRPTRDDTLFNPYVIDVLERCASRGPERWGDNIRFQMYRIYSTLGHSTDS